VRLSETAMASRALIAALALSSTLFALACARVGPVYPARPPQGSSPPRADTPPSRVPVHVRLANAALRDRLEAVMPASGEATYEVLRVTTKVTWARKGSQVRTEGGRVVVALDFEATVGTALGSVLVPFGVDVAAEPVLTAEYQVLLARPAVTLRSTDARLRFADAIGGVYARLEGVVRERIEAFRYDLAPVLDESTRALREPIRFALGSGEGCAQADVLAVEAGPTLFVDGLEKDFVFTVAPKLTVPCAPLARATTLPALTNVAAPLTGVFQLRIDAAARYDALERASAALFTDGRYAFSPKHPNLYLERPELYASKGALVFKVHLTGQASTFGNLALDGDVFLSGRPTLRGGVLAFEDLEPTVETSNLFLQLGAASDGDRLRDEARRALTIDVAARARPFLDDLEKRASVERAGVCTRLRLDRFDIAGVDVLDGFVRIGTTLTGQVRVEAPCTGRP
jgi:hypothetical protein